MADSFLFQIDWQAVASGRSITRAERGHFLPRRNRDLLMPARRGTVEELDACVVVREARASYSAIM
jgi:hypothetical protein